MRQVLFLGEKRDLPGEEAFCQILAQHFRLIHCDGSFLSHRGRGPELFLHTAPGLFGTDDPGVLLIAREGCAMPKSLSILRNTAAVVVSSEEEGQLGFFAALPVRVITCGLSSKDTLTFSSRGEGRAVVSLLRELDTPNGRIEPMDLPLAFSGECRDYMTLAAAAAILFFRSPGEKLFPFPI